MIKQWKSTQIIDERRTLNVSSHGKGLYLYLPKDLCEVYGINTGDRVKVQLLDLFKRERPKEETEKCESKK